MKALYYTIILLGFSYGSVSQTTLAGEKCSYYSLGEGSEAKMTYWNKDQKLYVLPLGKLPRIYVNKVNHKVTFKMDMDKPLSRTNNGQESSGKMDSILFSNLPNIEASMEYTILKEMEQSALSKASLSMGYILKPESKPAGAVLTFKSRKNSNIYDAQLYWMLDEDFYLTIDFLVIQECD